jgi:general secretion pathway protein K
LLTNFFAAAKKVSAAPHRGDPNRPLRNQGKANTAGKQPNTTKEKDKPDQQKSKQTQTP